MLYIWLSSLEMPGLLGLGLSAFTKEILAVASHRQEFDFLDYSIPTI